MRRILVRSLAFPGSRLPQTITSIYVVAGGLWVVLSEMLFSAAAGQGAVRAPVAILTRGLFIVVTAGLLYALLRRYTGAAAEAAKTMEGFFEAAVQAIVVSERDGRIQQVNRSAEAMFGYRRAELIGQPLELVLPAEDSPRATVNVPVAAGDAHLRGFGRRKDGTRFPVELTRSTVRIGETDRVMRMVTDVSARTRGEEAVARLAAIVESSQDSIVSQTLDGTILTWNAGAERIFGYAAGEIVGRSVALLIPPELPDELDRILEAVRRGERTDHYETARVRKDGQRIQVSLTISPIRDAEGRVVGVSNIARDVTDRLTLERAARRAETLAALGTLSAGIAHEINNPIGILSSRLELMEARPGLPPELREDLRMLRRNVDRVSRIIRSLLSAARQSPMEWRAVDLNLVVEETLMLVGKQMTKDRIRVVTQLDASLPTVRGQPHALQQVLMNLLVNARDAMPEGGTVRIETSPVTGQEEGVRLVVADTGPGIPADVLPRISEPFYTTKAAGTGLGLPLSYTIVREHGGRIEVDSAAGRGTTFIITLPGDQSKP
jgi:PAS domain S-box-containing protein